MRTSYFCCTFIWVYIHLFSLLSFLLIFNLKYSLMVFVALDFNGRMTCTLFAVSKINMKKKNKKKYINTESSASPHSPTWCLPHSLSQTSNMLNISTVCIDINSAYSCFYTEGEFEMEGTGSKHASSITCRFY